MEPIIISLLDTDLYKFTMQQCALRQFSDVWVRYVFKSRNILEWTKDMHEEFLAQIKHFCNLTFKKDELDYLSSLRFIKKDFIEFLKLYRPLEEHIRALFDNNKLTVEIEGPWYQTILWEIPVLAMISEIYYKHTVCKDDNGEKAYKQAEINLNSKLKYILLPMHSHDNGFKFSEFGTRRRFSFKWQDKVIGILKKTLPASCLVGTSNVYFAYKYNLLAVGTNAHEYYQVGQALDKVRLAESQKFMLQSWVNEYRGDLGIALSDTLGTDKFLKDFDLYFAKLYDGIRHDSGDPIVWGYKVIEHYKKLRISPKTKTLLFSDSLNFEKAYKIYKEFKDETNVTFGIGTFIMNDFEPVAKPLNIVMKLQSVNGKPVAKLSDDEGKTICEDEEFLHYLRIVANE
ncbi:nicotinate phosphoribosyltransferase [Brachyspira alvinipulli]|uniref:nicotinate phosphoribosyltransferase n=1 Tax=Brachyspira alvinipulli TaxID=84379 RepID=UPI000485F490|nr:nicotinate phosphoribosyltransferase [Brachyspira alvinipulli]